MRKADDLWKVYRNLLETIRFADQKIQVLVFVCGLFSAVIFREIIAGGVILPGQFIYIVIFFITFIIFIIIALLALIARTNAVKGENILSIIYFKDISNRGNPDEYYGVVKKISEEDFEKDISFQIYELSKVANTKFNYYKTSWYLLLLQLVIFIFLILDSFAK